MIEQAWIAEQQARFAGTVASFPADRPALLMSHNDADGLSAAALLARAMARSGRPPRVRLLGRGENAWSPELKASIDGDAMRPAGLVVADLGTRGDPAATGLPTVLIDHHVPNGSPLNPEADGIRSPIVISGFGQDPVPTSSLLAWWCAGALCQADDLLWLAAIGLIGDLGDKAPFDELAQARKRFGATALREATSLVNAPRRTASADASAAFDLLMRAESPKDLLSGRHAGLDALRAARDEVRAALDAGRRAAPMVRDAVAMIRLDTPCQIHPMVAQSWTGRLRGKIVLAANIGYRPGWVHFAARTGADIDLIDFLATHRPAGADEQYGNGHRAASGGALRVADWNRFVAGLGFGPEMEVRS
jgi:single-stranded-DNA-specific exonuclease